MERFGGHKNMKKSPEEIQEEAIRMVLKTFPGSTVTSHTDLRRQMGDKQKEYNLLDEIKMLSQPKGIK